MTRLGVAELASSFWRLAGPNAAGRHNLRAALAYALPLGLIEQPRFNLAGLRRWLARRGLAWPLPPGDRPLRAALLARAEHGLIFLDTEDPADEQRFSLAHELAHFLIEYWRPRQQVSARVGPRALAVLDGRRRAEPSERLDALLGHVALDTHLHLMDRTPGGHPARHRLSRVEVTADELALELLAPAREAAPLARAAGAEAAAALRQRFGLPTSLARRYAASLLPPGLRGADRLARLGLISRQQLSNSEPPARNNG